MMIRVVRKLSLKEYVCRVSQLLRWSRTIIGQDTSLSEVGVRFAWKLWGKTWHTEKTRGKNALIQNTASIIVFQGTNSDIVGQLESGALVRAVARYGRWVAVELDGARRREFWNAVDSESQVIATGTALPDAALGDWQVFRVADGHFTPEVPA